MIDDKCIESIGLLRDFKNSCHLILGYKVYHTGSAFNIGFSKPAELVIVRYYPSVNVGLLLEVRKSNAIVSLFSKKIDFNEEEPDADSLYRKLPITGKEIVAIIKRLERDNRKIDRDVLNEFARHGTIRIKPGELQEIKEYDSIMTRICELILCTINSKTRTIFYSNFALKGKIRAAKTA